MGILTIIGVVIAAFTGVATGGIAMLYYITKDWFN